MNGYAVPYDDDLTCPVPELVIEHMRRMAWAHPWRGDTPVPPGQHVLNTTAITEPGRPVRLLFTRDYGYHQSGWFSNADWETNLHLSVSHPRPDRYRKLHLPGRIAIDSESPSEAEVRAWGKVFYVEHHRMAWYEPPAGQSDPHRHPYVAHLRLFINRRGEPFMPTGEPYTLRLWDDGTSPDKVAEGRAGADVR